MTEVEVFAGVCGFKTVVKAESQPGYRAVCHIDSECPNFKKVADLIGPEPLNVMDELFKKGESKVLASCEGTIPHVSCPVPAAILKALEVGAGLALPKDATITFRDPV